MNFFGIRLFQCFLIVLATVTAAYGAVDGTAKANDLELDQEFKWLQAEAVVFTASKQVQSLEAAASVMTVYTEEDIRQQGLRSVSEILERTVGFFNTRNTTSPIVGTRGFVLGENEPYLLLIDGHNMNSLVDKGPGDYFVFPFLSQVKRVEIVRGPGSTLWGSDAALGIVHIITKDGRDVNGTQVTVDSASEDRYQYANVLYGDGDTDRDLLLSFTYAQAQGFPDEGFAPSKELEGALSLGPMNQIKDSWELYAKMRRKNFTIKARAADIMDSILVDSYWPYVWLTPFLSPGSTYPNQSFAEGDSDRTKFNRRRHYYISLEHNKAFKKDFVLDTKVYTDLMESWQQLANPTINAELHEVDESFSSKEANWGAETMLRATLWDDHRLLVGLQAVQTEIDPVYFSLLMPLPQGSSNVAEYRLLVTPNDKDQNLAAYIEDNWQILNSLDLIAGLRVDYNNLREDGTKLLPRFGAVWRTTEHLTAKYLYNTGYVRPPVGKSFLGQTPIRDEFDWETFQMVQPNHIGVQSSEEVYTQDLQLIYHRSGFETSLTGYEVVFKNPFYFYGVIDQDISGQYYSLLYINANTIKSYGAEFDFRHSFHPNAEWYGNFSNIFCAKIASLTGISGGFLYDLSKPNKTPYFTDNRTLTQFPHQIWNLGFNFSFKNVLHVPEITLNLHYRGWARMYIQRPENAGESYERLGPEQFADVNLRLLDLFTDTLEISLYAKNVFDNTDARYQLPLYGYMPGRGRSLGVNVRYEF